jgi:hypothetical protein
MEVVVAITIVELIIVVAICFLEEGILVLLVQLVQQVQLERPVQQAQRVHREFKVFKDHKVYKGKLGLLDQ